VKASHLYVSAAFEARSSTMSATPTIAHSGHHVVFLEVVIAQTGPIPTTPTLTTLSCSIFSYYPIPSVPGLSPALSAYPPLRLLDELDELPHLRDVRHLSPYPPEGIGEEK